MLSLLPDGIARSDLGELAGAESLEATRVLDTAGLLADRGERLLVHPAIREYMVRNRPPVTRDRERVEAHYIALAAALGARAGGEGGSEAAARLTPEVANVKVALLAGLDAMEPETAIEACLAWVEFERFTGLGKMRVVPLIRASTRARGDTLASCHLKAGLAPLDRADPDTARERFSEALELYRRTGSRIGQAYCIEGLGDVALRRADHEEARLYYEQALSVHRESGNVQGEANCAWGLGEVALAHSDLSGAAARFSQALRLYRSAGDILGETNSLRGLADVALERSEDEVAFARYQESLDLYRRIGDLAGVAGATLGLGEVALRRGDDDSARASYEEALRLHRRVRDPIGEANCLQGLGEMALRRDNEAAARADFQLARSLSSRVEYRLGEANSLQGLGDLELRADRVNAAAQMFQDALSLLAPLGEPYSIGRVHERLASLSSLSSSDRAEHRRKAREAWTSIGRDDLVRSLDEAAASGSDVVS